MSLPEVPWYMDLGARGKPHWKSCPAHLRDDVSFFLDHGYVVLKNSVSPELVEAAKAQYNEHRDKYGDEYAANADPSGFQRRLSNWHLLLPAFRDLYAQNKRALEIQDFLFNSPSMCYSSLTFESGSEQSTHRDSPYFTTYPEYYYFGVWTALEHVDSRNGALELYDRGHLLHEVDREAIFLRYYAYGDVINPSDSRLWNDYQHETTMRCEEAGLKKIVVPMEPGDTLIWHPHLPHGGSEIIDKERSRFSIVFHTIPFGVPVHGLNVFYQNAEPRKTAGYGTFEHDGRQFLKYDDVSFAHADIRLVESFGL